MKLKILLFIILLVFLMGCAEENVCGNKICEYSENYKEEHSTCSKDCPDCDDGNECTKDAFDYGEQECSHNLVKPCCGNDICESSEIDSCKADCISKLSILSKKVKITKENEDNQFVEYAPGKKFVFDEAQAEGSNVAQIALDLKNEGDVIIKNLGVNYECADETYQVHSYEICYRIPDKMEKSVCHHEFQAYSWPDNRPNDVVLSSLSDNNDVLLLPQDSKVALNLYFSPVKYLDYFWNAKEKDKFHNISCKITLFSVENELKEETEIKNYLIRAK
ncbi:hypothetical protein KY338_01845 [Candidatus Woesearchaeota archaeon]|nr:hypothetical protein [Candidatus Woesearchaeota archaeon]MBW3005980.1 hypothetical protein [Candidatus Woesearchaeota archaeon]